MEFVMEQGWPTVLDAGVAALTEAGYRVVGVAWSGQEWVASSFAAGSDDSSVLAQGFGRGELDFAMYLHLWVDAYGYAPSR